MREDDFAPLPLGASSFPALRKAGQIYVDKTEFIYALAKERGNYFLARPRRFGKSLLVSTFESLFRFGLRDFTGLKIEKLWKDPQTYHVVRLDFARVKPENKTKPFSEALDDYLEGQFSLIGFEKKGSLPLLTQLDLFLQQLDYSSLVLLIDEYDAPLTSSLENSQLFKKVRNILSDFYSVLKTNDGALRFLFLTGITKFSKTSIFSELNNLSDISLSPAYGTLLGYTKEEVVSYFQEYLDKASRVLHREKKALFEELVENYDGYCFERTTTQKVFAPWSVLKFLKEPENGFLNYWFGSGGRPSALLQYLKSHALRDPEEYGKVKSLSLSSLDASSDIDQISDIGLLTQAGYLTLKKVKDDTAYVGFPNAEVQKSMARLYTEEILGGRTLGQAGADDIARRLALEPPESIFHLFNKIFLSIDYQNYPVKSESLLRAMLQIFLKGAGLSPHVENHNAHGRSDLEVVAGSRRWIFELKFVRDKENAERKLEEGTEQMERKEYGSQASENEILRMVLVFSEEHRKFVKWAVIE